VFAPQWRSLPDVKSANDACNQRREGALSPSRFDHSLGERQGLAGRGGQSTHLKPHSLDIDLITPPITQSTCAEQRPVILIVALTLVQCVLDAQALGCYCQLVVLTS